MKDRDIHIKDVEFHGKDVEFHGKDVEFHGKDVDIPVKDVEFHGKDVDIPVKDVDIHGKDVDIHGKDVEFSIKDRGLPQRMKEVIDMRSYIKNISALIVGVIMIFAPLSGAQELTGNEILKKEDENRSDSQITISEMTIVHKSGAKRVRKIKAWMKGDDYTLVRFLSPANVKGTGFLSVGDDDWLYLPALKKVRRIATKEKGGSFMGSDFSYDDVGGGSLIEDYNAELLTAEEYEGRDCYVLELLPKDSEDISYSKLKKWVDKENFYSMKMEYYDIHGELLKVMHSSEFEKMKELWVTKRIEMQNVQKGSKTIIVVKETESNPEIPDKMFTTRQLERL